MTDQLSPTEIAKFWELTDRKSDDECWPWLGGQQGGGYGQLNVNQRKLTAHRISAALHLGLDLSDPKMFVCHHCDNRICVNPAHLFLGSCADNTWDAINKGLRDDRGENNPSAKLKWRDVRAIRRALREGHGQRELARKYKVAQATVWAIASERTWKNDVA